MFGRERKARERAEAERLEQEARKAAARAADEARAQKQREGLEAALKTDDPSLFDEQYFVFDVSPVNRIYDAAKRAIAQNAPKVFHALTHGKFPNYNSSFTFGSTWEESKQNVRLLLADISASAEPGLFWEIMRDGNEKSTVDKPRLASAEFLTPAASPEFIHDQLLKNPELFTTCLRDIGVRDPEKLELILAFAPKDDSAHIALVAAVVEVSRNEDALDQLAALLPHIDLARHGAHMAALVRFFNPEMAKLISDATEIMRCTPEAEETVHPAQESDIHVEKQAIPGGGTLTAIFNFTLKQQHNVIRMPGEDPVATTVQFRDIDKGVLAAMRRKYDAAQKPPESPPPAP